MARKKILGASRIFLIQWMVDLFTGSVSDIDNPKLLVQGAKGRVYVKEWKLRYSQELFQGDGSEQLSQLSMPCSFMEIPMLLVECLCNTL
jgi:hypothetical protein